jgi:hypothetical protein
MRGRRRSWAARGRRGRAGAGPGAARGRRRGWARARGRRRASAGVGGMQRVSVSEREKKEKPLDWLSLCSLPSAAMRHSAKIFFYF